MNLLDKKKYLIWPGLAFLLIPFFFACDDPNQLGILVDGGDQNIKVRDTTITLSLSTILVDSLRTDHYPNVVVGHSSGDSIFGEVTSIGYMQYGPQGGTRPGDTLSFEAAYLVFDIGETRSEGILTDEHWDFHEATDTLYRNIVYLADRSLPYDPTPIEGFDFNMDPEIDTVFQVPFNTLGMELFDQLVKAGVDSVFRDSLNRGMLHYPPLVAVPSSGSQGILSLNFANDTTGLYIEMKSPSSGKIYRYRYSFSGRAHFTQVIRDSGGAKLDLLNLEYEDQLEGIGHASMIHGIYTKIDMEPYIQFVESTSGVIINHSTLDLSVIDYASDDYISPFLNIQFFFIRGDRINGPGALRNSEKFFNAILTDGSYQSAGSAQNLLTMSYSSEAPNYVGTTTLFTQVFVGAQSNDIRKEIVIVNPVTTALKQSNFTEAKLTLHYTIIE